MIKIALRVFYSVVNCTGRLFPPEHDRTIASSAPLLLLLHDMRSSPDLLILVTYYNEEGSLFYCPLDAVARRNCNLNLGLTPHAIATRHYPRPSRYTIHSPAQPENWPYLLLFRERLVAGQSWPARTAASTFASLLQNTVWSSLVPAPQEPILLVRNASI